MHDTPDIWQLMAADDTAVVQSPEWYRQLLAVVNRYIQHDFENLIQMLYRMDVYEEKIRQALAHALHPGIYYRL
jgi:antitoxin component HigA of HigAB toxin-antitoxin module